VLGTEDTRGKALKARSRPITAPSKKALSLFDILKREYRRISERHDNRLFSTKLNRLENGCSMDIDCILFVYESFIRTNICRMTGNLYETLSCSLRSVSGRLSPQQKRKLNTLMKLLNKARGRHEDVLNSVSLACESNRSSFQKMGSGGKAGMDATTPQTIPASFAECSSDDRERLRSSSAAAIPVDNNPQQVPTLPKRPVLSTGNIPLSLAMSAPSSEYLFDACPSMRDLASRLTLHTARVFVCIPYTEFVNKKWMKVEKSPKYHSFIKHYNNVSAWIVTTIVSSNNHFATLKRILKFAQALFDLNNFADLSAVMGGLMTFEMDRLVFLWKALSKQVRYTALMKRLSTSVGFQKNYKMLRSLVAAIQTEPHIPLLALMGKDLAVMEEQTTMDKKSGMVNIPHLESMGTIIYNFVTAQNHCATMLEKVKLPNDDSTTCQIRRILEVDSPLILKPRDWLPAIEQVMKAVNGS